MNETYKKIIETLEKNIKKEEEFYLAKKKIDNLENRVKYFEKMLEMEDYDIFITCPYCDYEFQTDYDEDVSEIPCPECGRIIDIDWSENDDSDEDEDENEEEQIIN